MLAFYSHPDSLASLPEYQILGLTGSTLDFELWTLGLLKVLIAPDKFKGTLTARAAAKAIALGWEAVRAGDSLDLLPITDGGDGFGETVAALLRAKPISVRTVDAAHRPCRTKWWWEAKSKTAIIESATAIGLAMLPVKRFHPFDLDTWGLGKLLLAACRKRAQCCLLGIGGSATNDAGFGLARALGWHFIDSRGRVIDRWTDLSKLQRIEPPRNRRLFEHLLVAVDVQNPLLGKHGPSRVYGPQKGLRAHEFPSAERCLERLALVTKTELGIDFAAPPGAGAAGGLGFGLAAFAGGRLEPGFEIFAKQSGLERHLVRADFVITGEGCIDHSTLMGKGVGQIAGKCKEMKIPCIALAGVAHPNARLRQAFGQIHSLLDITSKREAMARPAYWLEYLARKIALATER